MKLVAPTRSTRFLPNLTLDWLTTAIRSTPGARRTFRSANLKESTTPCSIHSVSGNSPLISWAWVGWGRLCLKSTTYILLSRPNHHQGYKLTETLCFQRDKHLVKPRNTVYWAGSGAFFQVCRAEGATCSWCAPDGSRESVKCQVRQEACAPRWSNQLHDITAEVATSKFVLLSLTRTCD